MSLYWAGGPGSTPRSGLVKLGTLTITKLGASQAALEKALMFLPNNVPAGIAVADPMIDVRSAAYPVSFSERQ